jgi:toxin CcdB
VAQFDVYSNPIERQREVVPFVVDLQSGLLDQLPTRWVMPLAAQASNAGGVPQRLCPAVEVRGQVVYAWPHQAAPLIARTLGRPVCNLRHDAPALLDALDAVTSGI